jgi:cytochrome P450
MSDHWLTGALPDRIVLGADFYAEMARRHGDVASFRLGTWKMVLLSHPDLVDHVLRDRPGAYSKGELFGDVRVLLGDGLFFSEGARWRQQRRTLQPSFHPRRLDGIAPIMRRCVLSALPAFEAAARTGAPLDLYAQVTRITLDIAAQTLFGAALPLAARDRIGALVEEISRLLDQRMFSMLQVLPMWVPLRMNRRTRAAVAALDAIVYELVDARAPGADEGTDLLGALLAARDPETGSGLDRTALRDQVMTFFLAGHETTASALAWCLKLLCEHPEVSDKVRAEVDGAEEQTELPYTMSAFKEALRLYPPGWTLTRQALEDDIIGGHPVPRGTNLIVCPYALQRDPRFWDEPLAFRPERFPLDAARRKAWLPFGSGPRACIGGQFAMTEAAIVLSELMRRYRFELEPGVPITAAPLVTLRPTPGVWANLRPRCSPMASRTARMVSAAS